MFRIVKPTKQPPKLDEYEDLSEEAQKTIRALKIKYVQRINEIKSCSSMIDDSTNYYKHIYDATFKKEIHTPVSQSQHTGCGLSISQTSHQNHSYQSKIYVTSDSCQIWKRQLMDIPMKSKGDFNNIGRERQKNYICEDIWAEQENMKISPRLAMSPAMCLDHEEVLCNFPILTALNESPITISSSSKVEGGHSSLQDFITVHQQQDSKCISKGSVDGEQIDTKKVSKENGNLLCMSQNEDPFKSSSVFVSEFSPVLFNERPISEDCLLKKDSVSTEELKEIGWNSFSPVETEFDLRLSGFSPLDIGVTKELNVEELPFPDKNFQKYDEDPSEISANPHVFPENLENPFETIFKKAESHNSEQDTNMVPSSPENKLKRFLFRVMAHYVAC